MADPHPPSDSAGEAAHTGAVAPSRPSLASSASWVILGRLAPMGITVFLTPYVLGGLGIVRYGLFVLTGSMVGLLGSFDGGLRSTARRYFAVYAGARDVDRITQLLVSLILVISLVGVGASLAGWFAAPILVALLKMPKADLTQTIFLFRLLGILLTASYIHNIFVAVLQAYLRFSLIAKQALVAYAIWAAGLVATVHFDLGLRGVAYVFLVQEAVLVFIIVPPSLRYIRREVIRLLPWHELRPILSFALRVQVSELSALVNLEFDNLLLGIGVSVTSTTLYNSGANYGHNIYSLVSAVLGPLQTRLATAFGDGGAELAFDEFARLQRSIVAVAAGIFAAAGAASWFAITAWLGPGFSLGGTIGILLVLSMALYLLTWVIATYCTAVGAPGIQSRYGIVSVVVNLAATTSLLALGPLGVGIGTMLSQCVGLWYILRTTRRRLDPRLPNPLRSIPAVPSLLCASSVVAGELAIRPLVPSGGLGLLACTLPAAAGLAVFIAVRLGPIHAAKTMFTVVSSVQSRGLAQAAATLRDAFR